jgi:hypothetical protein
LATLDNLKSKFSDMLETSTTTGNVGKGIGGVAFGLLTLVGIVGYIWDAEPGMIDIAARTSDIVEQNNVEKVTGSTTIATMIQLADVLLHKRGGYLTNDIMPPGAWMDNLPNWEFGVVVQIRDMARTLRNNMSRSQSQSTEDAGLVAAENQFYFDNDTWLLPETEAEYEKGIRALHDYLKRLGDPNQRSAQFYARADNLGVWLGEVETRLGSLSQRLSASVGKRQLDTSLAGDIAARQSTESRSDVKVKTPWTELDDVFYQARGTTWALIHLLRAVEIDFRDVLEKKNALVSLQQIVRELEPTQDTLWSPIILNGSGLGVLANHSLVMASHISRANAAIIDLRRLLQEG